MSHIAIPYELGRVVDALGGGSAPQNLTTSYTPGTVVSTRGLGNISARVSATIAGGGATKIYLRLMDYTDSSKPRVLLSTRMDTGVTEEAHEFAASKDIDVQANLGGVVTLAAWEKKTDGAAGSGDTVTVDETAFNA